MGNAVLSPGVVASGEGGVESVVGMEIWVAGITCVITSAIPPEAKRSKNWLPEPTKKNTRMLQAHRPSTPTIATKPHTCFEFIPTSLKQSKLYHRPLVPAGTHRRIGLCFVPGGGCLDSKLDGLEVNVNGVHNLATITPRHCDGNRDTSFPACCNHELITRRQSIFR